MASVSVLDGSRNTLEVIWAILCLGLALILWLKIVRYVITEEMVSGTYDRLMSVVTLSEPFQKSFFGDLLHTLSSGVALVMALSMAFDGRYLNFEIKGNKHRTAFYAIAYVTTDRG